MRLEKEVPRIRACVIGLGKLGLCLATFYAIRGHDVVGVDINKKLLKALRNGECPIEEPHLKEALGKVMGKKLHVTDDYGEGLYESEISFIVTNTPSDNTGRLDISQVVSAADSIGKNLGKLKPDYHLVVTKSTVLPGMTRKVVKERVMANAGNVPGVAFAYSPEFIALGRVMINLAQPRYVLVGADRDIDAKHLLSFYGSLYHPKQTVRTGSPETIEMAKYASNIFFTTKISLMNLVADACNMRVPKADALQVGEILGLDERIGPGLTVAGMPFGGPCFPKDLDQFHAWFPTAFTGAVRNENKTHFDRIWNLILKHLPKPVDGVKVAVLGMTYKPNTDLCIESPSLDLVKRMVSYNMDVTVYDPMGMDNAREALKHREGIKYASSMVNCIKDKECAVVAVPWKNFQEQGMQIFTAVMKTPLLIDLWRIFDYKKKPKDLEYVGLGLGE